MNNQAYIKQNASVVYVEVELPEGSHKLEGKSDKPWYPRLETLGWFAQANPEWCLNSSSEYYVGERGWLEKAVVQDFSGNLPDELYAVVLCTGRCSWYLNYVFVSEEKARAYVSEADGKFGQLCWVVPIRKS